MHRFRFILLIVLLGLAIYGVLRGLRHNFVRGPQVGAPAPSFELPDMEGKPISLQALRGKAVLLNFWATWCGPCQYEMPSLESLYQKYKDRGFVVLGVSLDEEGWAPIREFLKHVPVNFPLVNDQAQKVNELYEIYRIPETYLIDPKGIIADKIVGPQDYNAEVFHQKVERLLPSTPK